MLGAALRREAQHSHAGLFEASHSLSHLGGTYGNLRKLGSIGHRSHSHVGHHKHTVLTILFLLRDEQQTTADAGNTRLALDDLQGRTQRVACR